VILRTTTKSGYGGGIYFFNSINVSISSNITGNQATWGGGINMYDSSSNNTLTFSGAVIYNNSSYGVYRSNTNSDPQGTATINWGSGNTDGNLNWTP